MRRRTLLTAAPAFLAAPSPIRAQAQTTLRFIPQADLTALDPVWTSVYVTRNYAYLVFDTLYGQDSSFGIRPQMVEGHTTEDDGKLWRLTLRPGLRFHDDTPVLARDAVASIRRWGRRDAFGQTLMATTADLSAPDDRTIQFRLNRPFPFLPEALGKIGVNMLPIMPERLANTDPFKQITEVIGSGPFRFIPDERIVGARTVFAKFANYVPRNEPPEWTTGGKVAHFDRVVWTVIPDAATAAAAMLRNEADWWEQPVFDLLPQLKRAPDLVQSIVEVTGNVGVMRFNQLQPPFDNPAVRRAIIGALDQSEFVDAVVGDTPNASRTGIGVFAPGTPMASTAGLDALTGKRDVAAAARALKAAGYDGRRIVATTPTDYPRIDAMSQVAADLLRRIGFNVDLQAMDWGTVIQRRANKGTPEQGGWNVQVTSLTGADMSSPAGHIGIRGNGESAWFGWPTAPELEKARNEWLAAPDLPAQKAAAARIQQQVFTDVPYLPLGQFFQPTVMHKSLTGAVQGMALFWNIRRTA